jgi:hypothetical protein
MKGIGKKVAVAFLSVVALLAVSGVISLSELSTLSYDTDEILAASNRDVEIAKEMLGAANDHSRAMLDVAIFDNKDGLAVCDEALNKISSHITSVYSSSSVEVKVCLDTLVNYGAKLEGLVKEQREVLGIAAEAQVAEVSVEPEVVPSDSLGMANYMIEAQLAAKKAEVSKLAAKRKGGRAWYVENYEPVYNSFVTQVKRYIDLSHSELAPRAQQLSKNAYRSVTPILISLAVMISVVLLLYYFIYIYGVKPILRMNRALSDYLSYRLPYKTKVEMVDGKPIVTWSPDMNGGTGKLGVREYKIWGKENLEEVNWTEVVDDKIENYQFFKVTVDMP